MWVSLEPYIESQRRVKLSDLAHSPVESRKIHISMLFGHKHMWQAATEATHIHIRRNESNIQISFFRWFEALNGRLDMPHAPCIDNYLKL